MSLKHLQTDVWFDDPDHVANKMNPIARIELTGKLWNSGYRQEAAALAFRDVVCGCESKHKAQMLLYARGDTHLDSAWLREHLEAYHPELLPEVDA